MNSFLHKVAVITGAGSGIGQQLALGLARHQVRLAVSDVNETALASTVDLIKQSGAEVHAAQFDVADRAAVTDYAEAVGEHYGIVHQLYNNAGVASDTGTILQQGYADFDRAIDVNFFGVVNCTKSFLPQLIASGDGHIVNISSLNGIMAQSDTAAYCSSKFAVRGFTESLRVEMLRGRQPVQISVVHPGGVRTNIANASRSAAATEGRSMSAAQARRIDLYNDKLLKMSAQRAAELILAGVAKGKPRIRVGSDAVMADLLVRLLPRQYPKLAAVLENRLFDAR